MECLNKNLLHQKLLFLEVSLWIKLAELSKTNADYFVRGDAMEAFT